MYTILMRNDIEGIAFDLDGTLYPNYRLRSKLVLNVLKELRLVSAFVKTRKIIRTEQENPSWLQGDFYEKQVEITAKILSIPPGSADLEKSDEPLKEKIDRLIYRAWEQPFKTIKLFKGVRETLTALREAGYKLGLLSDFPPEIKLEYLGLSGIWDAVLCSERCGTLKPHPLSFNELAAAMLLPPEKIIYVGNSRTYDVAGANQAGMKTAWIKPRFFPIGKKKPIPDFTFSDYRQLYDFMLN